MSPLLEQICLLFTTIGLPLAFYFIIRYKGRQEYLGIWKQRAIFLRNWYSLSIQSQIFIGRKTFSLFLLSSWGLLSTDSFKKLEMILLTFSTYRAKLVPNFELLVKHFTIGTIIPAVRSVFSAYLLGRKLWFQGITCCRLHIDPFLDPPWSYSS